MRIFVTGATGWIGSAVAGRLLDAGHDVIGLARSDASAEALEKKGARAHRGHLDDLDGIHAAASDADAVVHLANKHDWADPAGTNRTERAAVETICEALAGSHRPFVLAAALSGLARGRPVLESGVSPAHGPGSHRGGGENLALSYAGKGVRVISVRFAPTVHGAGDPGFIGQVVSAARRHGVSAYLGDSGNVWAAVHRRDAADLVRLALERAPAGSRLHAVAEEAVPTREIAEAVAGVLGVPVTSVASEDAGEHFGFVGRFFGMDMAASSTRTRDLLGWTPTGPTLIEDILAGAYTAGT